jgi:hypothetical protein
MTVGLWRRCPRWFPDGRQHFRNRIGEGLAVIRLLSLEIPSCAGPFNLKLGLD